jgi:hypothetical protein
VSAGIGAGLAYFLVPECTRIDHANGARTLERCRYLAQTRHPARRRDYQRK